MSTHHQSAFANPGQTCTIADGRLSTLFEADCQKSTRTRL